MKKIIKATMILSLSLIMIISSWVVVAAEVSSTTDNGISITSISDDEDGTKAYQLVYKYKYENSHLYRRRWNMTLGAWYDPDWILVY